MLVLFLCCSRAVLVRSLLVCIVTLLGCNYHYHRHPRLEEAMQITLNQQQEQFIAAQLASGNFTHAEEVANLALRLL